MAIQIVDPGAGTLDAALSTYGSDTEYHLNPGTYTGAISAFGDNIKILGPNVDVNPNTGVRVPEAVIDGISCILTDYTNIEFNGLKFTGSGGTPSILESLNTTLVGLVVRNNIFQNTGRNDIVIENASSTISDLVIEDNLFNGTKGVGNFSTMLIAYADGVLIQNNVSVDSDYSFCQLGGTVNNVQILNNQVFGAEVKGIQFYHSASNVLISGNLLERCNTSYGDSYGAIRFYAPNTPGAYSNIVISDNVIKDSYNAFLFKSGDYANTSEYLTMKDNTIIGSLGADIYSYATVGTIYFDRNWWEDPDNIIVVNVGGADISIWSQPEVNTGDLPQGLDVDSAVGVQRNGTIVGGGQFPFVARAVAEGKDKRPLVMVHSVGGITPSQAARGGIGGGAYATNITYRKP